MKTNQQYLDNLRHSTAHLLAAAVLELYPHAKLAIGPSIENGFYYDIDFGKSKISEGDLEKIESKMRELIVGWQSFAKHLLAPTKAKSQYKSNPYKEELIDEFSDKGKKEVSFYESVGSHSKYFNGPYWDLCKGGHVDKPAVEIKYFKLLSLAGAYWRGDEKNPMLTRIYGTAWPSQKELDDYLSLLEEARKRDHRRLGVDLDLFSTNELTGSGLILWHPNLSIVRDEVEKYWKSEHYKRGYKLVYTPHIASMNMFVKSRHYNKYINSMFPAMLHQYIEGESNPDYVADEQLKPMNCPNHIQIFKNSPKSYRELPFRMGELGTVYRYERKGTLHGMTRVRGFTQDDSHIFCTPEQVIDEIREVIKLTRDMYKLFGFTDYQAYLSTRPEKYLGSLEMWEFAQDSLMQAMKAEKIDYKIDEGEGVFYGPKIDSKVKDSIGREWQLGTIQFDFNMPDKAKSTKADLVEFWAMKTFRDKFKTKANLWKYLQEMGRGFDVKYIDKNGEEKNAYMIHRTILGSMERFFGVLIEHFGGSFPVWLSPLQVKVLPITDRNHEYAYKVVDRLMKDSFRVELDNSKETLGNKIRKAQSEKVPYMLVIGDKEEKDGKVAVRLRNGKDLGQMTMDEFTNVIERIIKDKSLALE